MPEIASRHHLRARQPRRRAGARRGGRDAGRDRAGGGHPGPGAGGRAARRLLTAKALAAARELPFAAGRSSAGSRRGELPASPDPIRRRRPGGSLRAAVPVPDRQRRTHAARARHRARRLRGARPHARRRGRRGLRQGREDARPGLSRRARRSSGWPRPAIPRPSPFRARAASAPAAGGAGRAGVRAEPRLLLRRAEDGAALHAARALRERGAGAGAPTWRPPTRRRSSTA